MRTNERNHPGRTFWIVGTIVGAAHVLSAWNGRIFDEEGPLPSFDPYPVQVYVAKDSLFLSSTLLRADEVAFNVTNEGDTAHGFAISGPMEAQLETEIAPGETKTLKISLESGTYMAYCPLSGHEEEESVAFSVGR